MNTLKKSFGQSNFRWKDSDQDMHPKKFGKIPRKDDNKNEEKSGRESSDTDIKRCLCSSIRKTGKASLIPKLKLDRRNTKVGKPKSQNEVTLKKLSFISHTPSSASPATVPREKSILKTQEPIPRKSVLKDTETRDNTLKSNPIEGTIRKIISDTLVFDKKPKQEALNDFERNVKQISEIWLRTSIDLTNTLKNLKKNPSLDPLEFEVESNKIQLAIKQAKSLTLIKTRNVIAEAKKLMVAREAIRMELENLLSEESLDLLRNEQKKNAADENVNSKRPKTVEGKRKILKEESNTENGKSCEQAKRSEFPQVNSDLTTKVEASELSELAKKTQIISQLKRKIFELQKTCEDQTLKYQQLQLRVDEFQDKFQWEHVLWKQITKLKEQIKGLQHSNKHLETQKQELESKMANLHLEINRLIQLNQVLNKKKFLLDAGEFNPGEYVMTDEGKKKSESQLCRQVEEAEKVLAEKENVIDQLKKVLDMMKDQENLAQKQIKVFESKIKELQMT